MLLLTHLHSDSWLSSRKERNACFLSLFWHFIQPGLSTHSVKLQPALGAGKSTLLTRLAQSLRMGAALFSFKDQPGLKVSPSHSQEEEVSLGFCLFVLWFWFGVFLRQDPVLSQEKLSAAHRVGGREQPLLPPHTDQGLQQREGSWAGREQGPWLTIGPE